MSPALVRFRTLLALSLTLAAACSKPTTQSFSSETSALVADGPAWTARIGGSGADQLNGVAVDSTGALVVVGSASTAVDGQAFAGSMDGLVAKYSSTGTKQWTRLAGTSAAESLSAVAVGSSDAIYVAGSLRSSLDGQPVYGGPDFWLSKYDATGTRQWTRVAGTAGNDGANAVAFQGGSVFVAGVTATALSSNTPVGRTDVAVIRYDESGTQGWAVSFGTTLDDAAAGIAVDASGNIFVAGTTSGAFTGNAPKGGKDIFLSRLSSSGAIAWTKQVGTSADDTATGVVLGADGGIYVAGITAGPLGGNVVGSTDAVLIKFDATGTQVWAKQLGSAALDEGLGVAADASAVYLTGRSLGQLPGANAGGLLNIFAAQYAFDGTRQFVREFSGGNSSGTTFGSAVAAANGRVLVVGSTSALGFDGVAGLGNTDGLVLGLCSGNNFACQTAGSCSVNRGGCTASQTCTPGVSGAVVCTCATGMTGSTTCSDVNECLVANGGCDLLTSCANTNGSRTCSTCPGGYAGNGATGCVDVNECANANGGCALSCINLPGSFRCGCSAGYEGDGVTCTDVNECTTNNGGCDALTTCTNTTGSYSCGACPTGYTGNGATGCVDIDECSTNRGGCAAYQTCTNIAGSRLCGCPAEYVDSGTACLKVGPAWTKRVGTTGTDQANAVAIDSAGNVIVSGNATGTLDGVASAGTQDAFVAKYSFTGAKLWSRQVGTSQADAASGVAMGSDDSIFVTGLTRASIDGQTAFGGTDLWLTRYDAAGTRLWSRLLGTALNDSSNAVAVRSGAVYVAGVVGSALPGSTAAGRTDIALARYNESGTLSWSKSFGSNQDDAAAGVAVDTLGNVYVSGTTGGALPGATAFGAKDIFLAKYDGTGTRLWTKQVGTSADDTGTGVAVGADGDIYVSGITGGAMSGTLAGSTDAVLMKFDPSGAIIWTQQLGSPAVDEGLAIAADDAFVYLTGRSLGQVPDANAGAVLNLFAAKYDLAGNIQTVREYSGGNSSGTTLGTSVAAAGGRLILGGATSATSFDGVSTIGGTDGLVLSLCSGHGFSCTLEGTCASNRGGCNASQTCTPDAPGYVLCGCGLGYTGSSVCADVNECLVNNGGCDALTTCTNATGSRSCGACPSGYTGTGATGCVAINNCLTSNGGCDANATCTVTGPATSSCACNTGYSGNGSACAAIDNCLTSNGGCDANATCTTTGPGTNGCACKTGYASSGDARCVDVDECATNEGGCDALTTCSNTPGSFSCSPCPTGYAGTGLTGCTLFVGPSAQLAFTVQPSTAQAGAFISPAVQVTVEDALGHRVLTDGSAVTLTLSTGTLSGTKTVTAVNGVATFSDLSVSLAGAGYTLTASAGALTAATSGPFNILTGAPARAVFTASPENTVAGASLTAVVVTLEDASGNVITSATDPVTVAIGTHGGLGTLSGTTTVDAVAGIARFSDLSIDKSGSGYTLVASVPGYQGGTSGTFDIGPGAISGTRSSLIASEASVAADGLSFATLTVTVQDAYQNPIADRLVTFGASGSNNVFTPTTCSTDLTGACSVTISSTLAQTETLTATFGAAEATASLTFVPGAPSAALSTIALSPLTATAGVTWAAISVTVVDAQGNPITDVAVELSPSGVMNVVEPVSGATDANGHFSALLTTMVAQSETVTALIGTGSDALTVTSGTLTFAPGSPSSSASSVAVQPGPFVAGTSTSVTVVALDVNANAIPNAMVTLSASGAGNTFSPTSGLTDASGTFVATLASTVAQSETVTATIGTDHLAQVTSGPVTFTPGEAAAALSAATASSSTITAGTSTTITVTVRDALGNVVPGTPVAVWADGAGNLFTPSEGTTGADGTFVSSFSSTLVQSVTVTASIGRPEPFTLTMDPIVVGPGPLSIGSSHMYVTGGPITADGLTQATVMVTSQDDYGNPAVGATFTLSASPPEGITIGPQVTQTGDAHGAAVFVVTATTAGNRTLSATVNGTPLWDLPQLKVLYPAIGSAVAPVKISGALTGCTTATAHVSRKVAVDTANVIYVLMNCSGTGYVATSRDGGATWSAPVSTGITGVTGTNELQIAAGEKNLAYVVGYSGASTILFSMTFDGGASWSAPWPVGSTAQAPYGLAYPSIVLRGTSAYVAYLGVGDATGPSGTKIYMNTTSGVGEYAFQGRTSIPTAETIYWRLLVDPASGHLYDVNENNSLYVSASGDSGATWGPTLPLGTQRGAYSSWALGGGFIYNAGAQSYASRVALADIDQADLTVPAATSVASTSLTGLQPGANEQTAVDADALGNGYFVTTTSSGEIDLQAVLVTSTSIGPITKVVASGGSHPMVQAGPKGSALVSYTSGGAVYSTVVVPQLTPTSGQAITTAVAPILISGTLANCSTQYSNTSQKIATDAGHVIYALMNCGGTAYAAVSLDGGASFRAPVNTGLSGVLPGTHEMVIAAGALGTAWVAAYTNANTIAFTYTNNGGAGWARPITVGGTAALNGGLGLVSLASIGTDLFAALQTSTGTKVYKSANSGTGAFTLTGQTTLPNAKAIYWRLLADQTSGDLFHLGETNSLSVTASANGGTSWGATIPIAGAVQGWSSWASGGGLLYNAGGKRTAYRVSAAAVHQADITTSASSVAATTLYGVIPGQPNQTALAADGSGNAFIVTSSTGGAIQVQSIPAAYVTVGPAKTVVASGGSWPAILTGDAGSKAALVTYTFGGAVYSSVVASPGEIAACPAYTQNTGPHNDCGGVCSDTRIDNTNCGTCGNACGEGYACQFGQCVCAPRTKACGGKCVPVTNDPKNCDGCGKVCNPGETCASGSCYCDRARGTSCVAPAVCLNGFECRCPDWAPAACGLFPDSGNLGCADLQNDKKNCGRCGRSCNDGEVCCEGTCKDQSQGWCCSGAWCDRGPDNLMACCNGVCTNTVSDSSNCGGCGQTCTLGAGGTGIAQCNGAGSCACTFGNIACKIGATNTTSCQALLQPDPNSCKPGDACYCGNYSGNNDCGCCGHKCPDNYQCVLGLCMLK